MKHETRCYKFTGNDRFWSVIAANDDYTAKEIFLDEYKYSEKKFKDSIKMERIGMNYKVRCPFFPHPVNLGILTTVVKFMPRVLADSIEYMDSDYQLK